MQKVKTAAKKDTALACMFKCFTIELFVPTFELFPDFLWVVCETVCHVKSIFLMKLEQAKKLKEQWFY